MTVQNITLQAPKGRKLSNRQHCRAFFSRRTASWMTLAATFCIVFVVSSIGEGRRISSKYDVFATLSDQTPLVVNNNKTNKSQDVFDTVSDQRHLVANTNKTNTSQVPSTDGITCENNNGDGTEQVGPCCAPWQYNADDWWLDHPDWEVSHEDDEKFCFSKILDNEKASFFRKIHDVQWNVTNCSQVIQRQQINSGWAASFGRVADAVWAAVQRNAPIQMTKYWDGMVWLYATNDTSSWAFCENRDMTCYLLPQSPCPQVIGKNDNIMKTGGKRGSIQWSWLKQYVGRMQQHVRHKIYEMLQQEFPLIKLPCTAMHVRRGDSGIPRRPFRRYAAISEYLEIGNIREGDNIVLLTDDATTIDEVEAHHSSTYNWIYANRPRNNGTSGGFDGHLPSGDPAYDFVAIQAELQMASLCNKLVHGSSSFADRVYDAMILAGGTNITRFELNTRVSVEEAQANFTGDMHARGSLMLNEIKDAYRQDERSAVGR